MLNKIIEILEGNEALDISIKAQGEGNYRLMLALKPISLPELSAQKKSEDKDKVEERAQTLRAKLVEPVVFVGSMAELEGDLNAFIEMQNSDVVKSAKSMLEDYASQLKAIMEKSAKKKTASSTTAKKAEPKKADASKVEPAKDSVKADEPNAEPKAEKKVEPAEEVSPQSMLDLMG